MFQMKAHCHQVQKTVLRMLLQLIVASVCVPFSNATSASLPYSAVADGNVRKASLPAPMNLSVPVAPAMISTLFASVTGTIDMLSVLQCPPSMYFTLLTSMSFVAAVADAAPSHLPSSTISSTCLPLMPPFALTSS